MDEFKHKGTGREYFYALYDFISYMKIINSKGKPYEMLYKWLIEFEKQFDEENEEWPTLKHIATEIQIDTQKVTKYLKEIYNEICEFNKNNPEVFVKLNQILCYLSFKYYEQSAYFNIGLEVIPRKGDYFSYYFIQPTLGHHYFYVDSISHNIENSKHKIRIKLVSEKSKLYTELLKEKAVFQNFISELSLVRMDNYDVKQFLLKHNLEI
jgi:hypothetical protein